MYKRRVETKVIYTADYDNKDQFKSVVNEIYPSQGWRKVYEQREFMESGYAVLIKEME